MSRKRIDDPVDVTKLSPEELKKHEQRLRKRASRENQEKAKAIAALDGRKVDLLGNVRTYCSKNKFQLLQHGGSKDYRIIALLQSKTNPDLYVVQERSIAEGRPSILQRDFDSKDDAIEDYNVLLTGNRPKNLLWRSIEHYTPQAQAFILSHMAGGKKDREPIWDLGFLYAVAELLEFGFSADGKIIEPSRAMDEKDKRNRANYRRSSLAIIGNQKLSSDDLIEQSQNFCERVAKYANTESNYIAILSYTNAAMEVISRYPKAFGTLWNSKFFWKDTAAKVLKKHLKTATNPNGRLRRKKSYPYIRVDDLNEMFSLIKTEELINIMVVSLSTGLRVKEMRRLALKKSKYVLNKSHLNYKGNGLDLRDYLISKTDAKVDVANLTNPKLSLVSRVILNNEMPMDFLPESPFYHDSLLRKKADSPFKKYPEKSLRATCATMLAYCDQVDTAKAGRATRDMAAQRLGHINTQQVIRKYAPHVPAEFANPADYFKYSSTELNGINISDYSTMWDAFLLDKWLEWYEKNKRPYYEKIKGLVLKEHSGFAQTTTVTAIPYKKVR